MTQAPKRPRRTTPAAPKRRHTPPQQSWDADAVRALRAHLGATQGELAGELGVRQQTVSEWETEVYRPRGASAKLLSMVAEQAEFTYVAESYVPEQPEDAPSKEGVADGAPFSKGEGDAPR